MAKYSGSKIIVECLLEQGVDTVFGYPGGAILNLYDELYKNQDRQVMNRAPHMLQTAMPEPAER